MTAPREASLSPATGRAYGSGLRQQQTPPAPGQDPGVCLGVFFSRSRRRLALRRSTHGGAHAIFVFFPDFLLMLAAGSTIDGFSPAVLCQCNRQPLESDVRPFRSDHIFRHQTTGVDPFPVPARFFPPCWTFDAGAGSKTARELQRRLSDNGASSPFQMKRGRDGIVCEKQLIFGSDSHSWRSHPRRHRSKRSNRISISPVIRS